jgi:two-component system sensor histidine kinase/response regulator
MKTVPSAPDSLPSTPASFVPLGLNSATTPPPPAPKRTRKKPAAAEEDPPAPPADTDRVDILLVDDSPEKLIALEAALTQLDQNVVKAQSGREALRLLLQRDFAVILLDVNMPGMDGFETASLIRQRPANKHTPIIFVTAFSTGDLDIYRGYALGAVDYLFTPVTPDVLRSKVLVFTELAKKSLQIQRQAESLRQHAHSLQTLNQELESFSYSLAHDLRAPLRSISTYAELLMTDEAECMRPEAVSMVKNVHRNSGRMLQLMDDFLGFFRVARADPKRELINMRALVREAIAAAHPTGNKRLIDFEIGSLPNAMGDPAMILQVYMNLLSNAVKFTSTRERARIEIGCDTQRDPAVYFVRDNGVGFDMKYASKLFGVFERLHAREAFDGTGIGLATVQKIVLRHGGTVWAEASEGNGATFYFTLP